MGVLDDAIREHLELKRKHGATEQEVSQQEQEALGPPVRQPVEQADEPVADPMADDLEQPTVSEPGPREDELLHDPIDEAFAEPAAEEPAEDAGEHDVLEETPDFLEETPEHDRLWFEQKPPRDFDFDE